jgi:hypothetical protein
MKRIRDKSLVHWYPFVYDNAQFYKHPLNPRSNAIKTEKSARIIRNTL